MINIKIKIIDIFDIEKISLRSGDDIRLRLEVFFDIEKKVYGVKIYRLEFYSLKPTFNIQEDIIVMHDALIYVLDEHFMGNEFNSDSAEKSIEICLKEINMVFNFNNDTI